MPDNISASHLNRFSDILRRLIRLRPRLKAVVPENEAGNRLLQRLVNSHPQGAAASLADLDQLYGLGVVLAQQTEPMTMKEMSQALNVPLSTATRMVDWLVKNEFAARHSDPEDRRVVRVALTPAGQAMYQAGDTLLQKRVEFLLQHFTPTERESLVKLLTKLVQALESEL